MIEDYEGSRNEFLRMLAENDSPPAYVLRAQRVESVWQNLIAEAHKEYAKLQDMPRTRLAQLAHLIDHNWATLTAYVATEDADALERLHDDWQPKLLGELLPTTSRRQIQRSINDLRSSFERFNRRWQQKVDKLDLEPVNYQREQYNDYYLVEKAAALGSDKLAEMGFQRLELANQADILAEVPLLVIPQSVG